ncbi:MAG: C40 family peptidase [Bacteroidia bacterium]
MKSAPKLIFYTAWLSAGLWLSACHSHKKSITKTEETTAGTKSNVSKPAMVAGLLGVDEKEVHKKKLYQFVSDWYGVPYKYGGCDKSGTDCSCLTDNLYTSVYQKKLPRSATEMARTCEKVGESSVKEGDLVFFKINSKEVSHVGVVLRNNKFVHASTSRGVIISDINESYYKKYFYCYGKMK